MSHICYKGSYILTDFYIPCQRATIGAHLIFTYYFWLISNILYNYNKTKLVEKSGKSFSETYCVFLDFFHIFPIIKC